MFVTEYFHSLHFFPFYLFANDTYLFVLYADLNFFLIIDVYIFLLRREIYRGNRDIPFPLLVTVSKSGLSFLYIYKYMHVCVHMYMFALYLRLLQKMYLAVHIFQHFFLPT